jgi:hypothetical protein
MAKSLIDQPAFKDMVDHETQKIIYMDMPIGEHFTGLAAIPDWIKIKGNTCIITDLKTAFDADDRKYHYKCLDFGYYRQFAVMKIIINKLYPEVKEYLFRHLVVEKDKDGIFAPSAFYLSNEQVENNVNLILDNIIPAITNEKEFLPKIVDWKNAITIGEFDNDEF